MKKQYHKTAASWLMHGLLLVSLFLPLALIAKSPQAGTVINNQASATYKDASGVRQRVTSNIVETLIQQVGAMELMQSQARHGAAGNIVYFSHVLTNLSNGEDTYDLDVSNLDEDDYDFVSLKLYADADKNGLPDSSTTIAATGLLSADEAFYFIVAAEVPASGVADGDSAQLSLEGISQFDSSVKKTNTDSVTVSDKAIIDVTKSLSSTRGASPGGKHTVTLSYRNNGQQNATNVVLIDALPQGMSYVADSARWSETGGAVTLTDTDAADAQGTVETITYCAYAADNSCAAITTEAGEDADSDSNNQVTAVISQVATGASGVLTFEVNIDSGLRASTLVNTAEYEYHNGAEQAARTLTNQVPFEIEAQAGVVANGSQSDDRDGIGEAVVVASAEQGDVVSFDNIIWNTGNIADSFDISMDKAGSTFPAGTTFFLYQSDGFTPLMDTNGNGISDTGRIEPGGFYKVVLEARLAANASGDNSGSGFQIEKTATSFFDDSISNAVVDKLSTIVAESVDLTNNAAVGDDGALAEGNGPKDTAQVIESVSPGGSAVFRLYVNNTSNATTPRSYQLQYSKDKPFVAGSLEANWKISFHADAGVNNCSTRGQVISATANIAPGSHQLICAVVTVSADAVADGTNYPVYFRAISEQAGVSDIKHDAVTIAAQPAIELEPDQQGQIQPGNTIVYTHQLLNTGNKTVVDVTLDAVNSLATDGWAVVLYEDTNNDGLHTAADQKIGAYTLAPGSSKTVFAKIFAPANTSLGTANITTITVSGKEQGTANELVASARDVTTTNKSQMTIVKKQAPDVNCDGEPDGGLNSYVFTTFSAAPRTCVLYELTATNNSAAQVNNVRVFDATPAFTTHFTDSGVLPVISKGAIARQPGEGSQGVIEGNAGSVAAGGVVVLNFGVRVD